MLSPWKRFSLSLSPSPGSDSRLKLFARYRAVQQLIKNVISNFADNFQIISLSNFVQVTVIISYPEARKIPNYFIISNNNEDKRPGPV